MLNHPSDPAPTRQRSTRAYRQLVFDCDGVLFDSNGVKEANIRSATLALYDGDTADRFVEYFVSHNGLPREEKIARFFRDPLAERELLERYNDLNATTIPYLDPDPAARAFVERAAALGLPLHVLSGGDEGEVRTLLTNSGLAPSFREVLGGPTPKAVHLARLKLTGPTCYFGDSFHDYEVATQFGFDFVFMSRYTQFDGWQAFFADRPEVEVAHDFRSLNAYLPCCA